MIEVVAALALAGGAVYLTTRRKVGVTPTPPPTPEPPPYIPPAPSPPPVPEPPAVKYSVGDILIHRETGQRVRITAIDINVDAGEYTIQWPSGSLGRIHRAQLDAWFVRT